MSMLDDILYPASNAYNTGKLRVDDIHQISYEEFGCKQGIPIVYLHGGPGAGHASYFHRFFNPEKFRIIIYDQRGAPMAHPVAEIRNNSPDLLVEDNEQLRNHLGVETWHVFGGSWGATLALLYAERYPEKVSSLTLRGVFLMRQKEIDWFLHDMSRFFPENRKEFEESLPEDERGDLLEFFFKRLTDPDPHVHMPAAHTWARYENGCAFLHLLPDGERNEPDKNALCIARLEAAFFRNHMLRNRILDDVNDIRNIPTMILQGRYDVICPPETAYELKQKLSNCCLQLIQAGHSAKEPAIMKGLVAAATRIQYTGTPVPLPQ